MKIYKFGGASVKSAEAVRNVARIIDDEKEPLIVVVSAMGKITNKLEEVCNAFFQKTGFAQEHIAAVKDFHYNIIDGLFTEKENTAKRQTDLLVEDLAHIAAGQPSMCYDYEYDRIVSFGERISTAIVSAYLNSIGVENKCVDIRHCVKTDDNYRDANIDMALSETLCNQTFTFSDTKTYVTQGFIAGTLTNQTTTLGREGSDYTAAVLANLLNAKDVIIWKDVPGVMNADPKRFPEAQIMPSISYKEAVELSNCGAQVIHPKTIKPIQNKNIPLLVKSFVNPQAPGTVIGQINGKLEMPPVYIVKENQLLLTLTPRDFSFVAEEKLSQIFSVLAHFRLKLHLMQHSAINFTFVIDYNEQLFEAFVKELMPQYEVLYNKNVTLTTIRHYNNSIIRKLTEDKEILVEQRSRLTSRFVTEEKKD